MGKAQIACGDSSNLTSAQTRFSQISGAAMSDTTEANTQITVRYANIAITNLIANITTNSLSGGTATSTVRTRVAGANGNCSVSINNGSTGQFADTSSTDNISTGQAINYQILTGGTSGNFAYSLGCTFDSATDTFSRLCSNSAGTTYSLNATATFYGFGILTFEGTTEAKVATRIRSAMSAKNLSARIVSNSRTTSTTVKSRVNGADGNLAVSISAAATGTFEDTSHTDSISAGSDYNFAIIGGAEVTNLSIRSTSVEMISTAGEFIIPDTNGAGGAVSAQRFFYPGGRLTINSTESLTQLSSKFAYTAKNLAVYVGTFAGTSGTARLRIGSANSSLSISTTGTGIFEDTSNTQAIAVNDLINLAYTGTGGNQNVTSFSVMGVSSSVFNESVSEALALAETVTSLAVFASAISESVSLADTVTAIAVFASSIAESISLAETITTIGSFGAIISEALALADTSTSSATFGSAVSETLALADSVTAVGDMGMSLTEAFNLSDSITSTGTFSATVSEAINLVDTVRIFVPPIPPTPTPQPGGGGSGGNAGGAHRQVRPSGKRHITTAQRSNQHPDNSLPESRSDFRKIERQIATERDDDEILEILGMFLSVKDRRE